jgi:hypothetical protein
MEEYQGLEVKTEKCANIVEKTLIRVSTFPIPFELSNLSGKPIQNYYLIFR